MLSEWQRGDAQVKCELWGIVSALNADKNYLIGTKVIIETDCLPFLDMVSGCATPDQVMFRWIAYINSLNPEIWHILGKDNTMDDMLSRAWFEEEDDIVLEDEDVSVDFFESTQMMANKRSTPDLNEFNEDEYENEWLLIGRFLSTMVLMATVVTWTKEEASQIRKKMYTSSSYETG